MLAEIADRPIGKALVINTALDKLAMDQRSLSQRDQSSIKGRLLGQKACSGQFPVDQNEQSREQLEFTGLAFHVIVSN